LEECAAIDGASRYRIFWSIVLPLAIPGLVATFLFVLVFTWNEYLLALFLSSANSQTLPLVIAGQNATRGPQWWNMSVLILIMIIPVIVIAIVLETVYYAWFADWRGQGLMLAMAIDSTIRLFNLYLSADCRPKLIMASPSSGVAGS
jgi:ABC-type spermidine/putrescine transport system permease subunit II